MKHAKIRVDLTHNSLGSRVWIDEVEVRGLRAISIRAGVDEVSVLTLELVQPDVEITGEAGRIDEVPPA